MTTCQDARRVVASGLLVAHGAQLRSVAFFNQMDDATIDARTCVVPRMNVTYLSTTAAAAIKYVTPRLTCWYMIGLSTGASYAFLSSVQRNNRDV